MHQRAIIKRICSAMMRLGQVRPVCEWSALLSARDLRELSVCNPSGIKVGHSLHQRRAPAGFEFGKQIFFACSIQESSWIVTFLCPYGPLWASPGPLLGQPSGFCWDLP